MCIFTNDKDIPGHVRLSTRTLQYLIIPLLSLALLIVGVLHLEDSCPSQPLLSVWHIVAGSTGLVVPILYLLFDDLNPALAKKCPALSEALDNVVVFVLPVYILFEVCWLVTGTVWVGRTDSTNCDRTIYIFSVVVIVNFWIHILTPLVFMLCLCCFRVGVCSCSLWTFFNNIIEAWTSNVRLLLSLVVSVPLGLSMLLVGGFSLQRCSGSTTTTQLPANLTVSSLTQTDIEVDIDFIQETSNLVHIPVWLTVSGGLVLLSPVIYFLYDRFCKPEDVNATVKNISQLSVILYLLTALAWALVGFVWIFGAQQIENQNCGHDSNTYWFAFASLIVLNGLMDVWICFKICVILYWALISEE